MNAGGDWQASANANTIRLILARIELRDVLPRGMVAKIRLPAMAE